MIGNTIDINAIEKSLSRKSLDEFVGEWTKTREHYARFYVDTLRLVKKNLGEEEIFEWAKHLALKKKTRGLACLMLALGNPGLRHEEEIH